MAIVKYELVSPKTNHKKPFVDQRGALIIPSINRLYRYCVEAMRYNTTEFCYEYFLLLSVNKFDEHCYKCRVDDYGRLKVNLHGKLKEFVNDEIKVRGNIKCDYIESEPDYDVWKLS